MAYGIHFRNEHVTGRIVPGSELERWFNSGHSLREILGRVTVIKSGGRLQTGYVALGKNNESGTMIFMKEYRRHPLPWSLTRLAGIDRASRVWNTSWRLLEIGICVPRPVAVAYATIGNGYGKSYSCSEWLQGCANLSQLVKDDPAFPEHPVFITLMNKLANAFAIMHRYGIIHGDLKWTNIQISESRDQYWLTDLDGARRNVVLRRHHYEIRDLARFLFDGEIAGISDECYCDFLDVYCGIRRCSPAKTKADVRRRLATINQKKRRVSP